MYAPRRFRALLDASEFISELDFSIFTMCNTIDPVTLTHPRLVVENAPASDSGPMGHLGSRTGLQPGEVPFWFRTRNPDSPISAALTRWDEKAGLRGMRYAPNVRRAQGTKKETGYEKV